MTGTVERSKRVDAISEEEQFIETAELTETVEKGRKTDAMPEQ